jgi:hypothetical protein
MLATIITAKLRSSVCPTQILVVWIEKKAPRTHMEGLSTRMWVVIVEADTERQIYTGLMARAVLIALRRQFDP